MKTVVELIMLNSERHKEFEQYCAVIEMAELHKLTNPDICIESCKALVEGISKTILVNVDPTKTHATIDKENLSVSKLFKDAVDKLGE
ncbi:MAG: hypothetical protein JEZ10_07200, partial [Verrucomicrobia bacterium]|nr:hypothetical protein [Verrucomicrobiota bacterium]